MPIFSLDKNDLLFPPPQMADSSGLLAVGGMLNVEWVLEAYSIGAFPWFSEDDPIMWWSPNPRSVVLPGQVKISKSMRTYFNNNKFELKVDSAFNEVIQNCQKVPRVDQDGTWITSEIIDVYSELHELGFAHSFETWFDGKLVGGLYGISLGKMFFGESMFSKISNASKYAFISLSKILKENNFSLLDCQIPNPHLVKMGCIEMKRSEYLELLILNKRKKTLIGNWGKGVLKLDF